VVVLPTVDMPGASHLELAEGVSFLDPATAVFKAIVDGWERQQLARYLKAHTIAPRLALVRRFATFTGLYPWQWTPVELEEFSASLVSSGSVAESSLRNYQSVLRAFCGFVTDARYGWVAECEKRFGQAPVQIAHEWNTITHVNEFDGQPGRRALTYDEVQALFDAADARVAQIRARKRKGALAAARDAVILKTVYAYGVRRNEAAKFDLADFRRNARAAAFGTFGSVQVRFGKSSKGGPPKRRTVLTVPEMDWIVEVLTAWTQEVRPLFGPGAHPAVFVTERCTRISPGYLDTLFSRTAAQAGLPRELELHCLRHSYVTHLLEFGYPPLFVQQQVGHSHASTLASYTSVSDEFRNRLMDKAMARYGELLAVAR
jgi:site-specific recombinase XerD